MNRDDNVISFRKDHGFEGEWSNVMVSTHDLLRVLEYCASDKMDYTAETKAKIRGLINWINSAKEKGDLTHATNFS